MRNLVALLACVALLGVGPASQSIPQAEHHHHDAAESVEGLGQVSFPTSCASHSQEDMQRGVALLHSFGYSQARMQFEAIAKEDPGCAMAHWGIAMTQF